MVDPSDPTASEGLFDGLSFRAIALGAVVDHVATTVFAVLLILVASSGQIASDDPKAAEAAFEALASSPGFLVSSLVGGLICSVLAAFVGARWAGRNYVRHGIWVVVVSSALVLLLSPGGGAEVPEWVEVTGWVLIVPAGMLGGALAQWADERDAASESPEEE